jgi:hypothetical protein
VPGRQKGGPAAGLLGQLRDCITRGLDATADARTTVLSEMAMVRAVAATVDAAGDEYDERRARFDALIVEHTAAGTEVSERLARRMTFWRSGLFLGDGAAERHVDPNGRPFLPENNYDIERSFRLPKGHARHVHGHAHAGVELVQRGATLLPTLDAHALHSAPFTHDDLRPYFHAPEPEHQKEVRRRAHVMRRARSEKQRPLLLTQLRERYKALV